MSLALATIAEEAAACRAAFAARPRARYAAHVHHDQAAEPLDYPIENRIVCILVGKPRAEQALRLHCLRPITVRQWRHYDAAVRAARDPYDAAVRAARDAYDAAERPAQAAYDAAVRPAQTAYDATVRAAHDAMCAVAECPWDGKTIFRKPAS